MTCSTVKHYFITLFVFLVLDAIRLGLIAQPFYQAQIGFLLAEKADLAAAGVFYLLCVAGLVTFVADMSGRFFHLTMDEKPAAPALNREIGRRVWEASLQLTGFTPGP